MPLTINGREIHLWCTYFENIRDESLLASYRAVLSKEERQMEARFYFDRDRRRYLITRALVRTTLSKYADLSPHQWKFSPSRYGRPEITNVELRARNLSINISHTNCLIILGVAFECDLGVDVENVKSREVSLDIADRFFSPKEVSDLYSIPADQRKQRFFELWTLKESYIKARGMGLAIPLNNFAFRFLDQNRVSLWVDHIENDSSTQWQFWQFWLESVYLVAVCARRLWCEPPKLVVKEVIPLLGERTLEKNYSVISD